MTFLKLDEVHINTIASGGLSAALNAQRGSAIQNESPEQCGVTIIFGEIKVDDGCTDHCHLGHP
jgi:hypothetical protein